jgi:DNA ligase-1
MSEKFDGLRAYWDGKQLFSKQGNKLIVPHDFTDQLPDIPLDGELWLGRGSFEKISSVVKLHHIKEWREVKYVVFDLPSSQESYETRMEQLKQLKLPKNVQIVDVEECKGQDHLDAFLSSILEKGGEGVMLNKAKSKYTPGRSSTLYKVKVKSSI